VEVSAIYSQGSSLCREDGLVMTAQLFGVFDGISEPYAPKYPMRKFNGLTGGEMVARLCEAYFHGPLFYPRENLRNTIHGLNSALGNELRWEQIDARMNPPNTGALPGATLAFTRITEDTIEVLQAGDCTAVIELRNGEIIVSPNQVRAHDTEMQKEIERIQREVAQELFSLTLEDVPDADRGQVRGEMWNRFLPILLEARLRDVNRRESPHGYGVLNGQLELLELLWERTFHRNEVATLLLLSDGMIPWTVMRSTNDREIGRTVLAEFKRRGLAGLLLSARGIEEQTAAASYMNQAEATAVALAF